MVFWVDLKKGGTSYWANRTMGNNGGQVVWKKEEQILVKIDEVKQREMECLAASDRG